MKFIQFRPNGLFHLSLKGKRAYCKVENRAKHTEILNIKDHIPTEGRLCKVCQKKAAQTLKPSPRKITINGQTLKNRPINSYMVDPSRCKAATGHLWPEGPKLLMLHIRPAETTWYFRDPEDLQEHISLINQYNKNRYDTLKVHN